MKCQLTEIKSIATAFFNVSRNRLTTKRLTSSLSNITKNKDVYVNLQSVLRGPLRINEKSSVGLELS